MTADVSARRRRDVVAALRRGTVPEAGLDLLAVGLDRFASALDDELDAVASGGAVFKAVRGEYGAGKTFFTRHLAERALRRGFAAAEVQISETQTPLHRLETVYRRVTETMRTSSIPASAFRAVLDSWLFTLESDALDGDPALAQAGDDALAAAVDRLLERRLAQVTSRTPVFAQALRGYRAAITTGDAPLADGLAAWMGGQPQVAAAAKRAAGVRGELDHFGAMAFLQGLLTVLRDAGHPGLVLVLDEVETLQRVRGDVRDKALNALRQLLDEVDSGRFPGLYLLVTGTPAFYDGPSGAQRLAPLAQRLATDLGSDPRFDNPRAVQLRLPGFDRASLVALGVRVRDLYADGASDPAGVRQRVDDAYLATLADAVTGALGGKVGVAPRVYLKKLVADVLDRVDQFPDFDPRRDYALTVRPAELSDVERAVASGDSGTGAGSLDDIALDLPDGAQA
ncbi:MAG: BREX system ATP-binding protein BrxD [Kineosporiaceae bacterium]